MHLYYVYAMKEEVSKEYYYKTELLFRFLKEYHRNSQLELYKLQFHFITEPFPLIDLVRILTRYPRERMSLIHGRKLTKWVEKRGIIEITNDMCLIQCESFMEAEQMLFQKLRDIDGCFFIAEFHLDHYGWVSPQRKEMLL
ncbi:sporulation inhibitor of replication protein SirA [Thalassobacillus pellis]|uniref:sporulation inhibitor of replication protein SirA n=1 Tax=Thalassobacillus pellis TaxID=748008 RepID=UPI00196050B0|nr:sporulation inhibitor of replication protein SirA [Thalassobacillus pellis]MBM7552642.1 hypothetical protein [Thalassobacillus pellis]